MIDPAPLVAPELEARHLAACRVERIATAILAAMLTRTSSSYPNVSRDSIDARVDDALYAARLLAERLPK